MLQLIEGNYEDPDMIHISKDSKINKVDEEFEQDFYENQK